MGVAPVREPGFPVQEDALPVLGLAALAVNMASIDRGLAFRSPRRRYLVDKVSEKFYHVGLFLGSVDTIGGLRSLPHPLGQLVFLFFERTESTLAECFEVVRVWQKSSSGTAHTCVSTRS